MKKIILIALAIYVTIIAGCSKKNYVMNGERIYREGKNLTGDKLLDRNKSAVTFIKSCQGCHDRNGDRMHSSIITWRWLTDPGKISVPYTDSLFFRFIDKDLKSNGSPVKTGVHWKMSDSDKKDLIAFLKLL